MIGQIFSVKMLPEIILSLSTETSVVPLNFMKEENLHKDIRAIEAMGLIARQNSDPDLSYTFVNSLVREGSLV